MSRLDPHRSLGRTVVGVDFTLDFHPTRLPGRQALKPQPEYLALPFVVTLPGIVIGRCRRMTTKAGPPLPLRRLLRTLDGVELWHIEDSRNDGQRIPTIRYVVKSNGSDTMFERSHLAWRHFQQLTNAPDRDTRPQPPPLDPSLLTPKSGKSKRRRRRQTPS